MSKRSKEIQTIRVEVMPQENPNAPRIGPADAKKMLKELVERQVAEIMAQRDEFVFQPFFQNQKVSNEIRRLQTMPERNKWGRYYDRWGCLHCHTRKIPHGALGMCQACHRTIQNRLNALIKDPDRNASEIFCPPDDVATIAQRALVAPSNALLPTKKERTRRPK
jgi:hypothetical protein